jgi:hypothetical protein
LESFLFISHLEKLMWNSFQFSLIVIIFSDFNVEVFQQHAPNPIRISFQKHINSSHMAQQFVWKILRKLNIHWKADQNGLPLKFRGS